MELFNIASIFLVIQPLHNYLHWMRRSYAEFPCTTNLFGISKDKKKQNKTKI